MTNSPNWPDLTKVTSGLGEVAAALRSLSATVQKAAPSADRIVVADHPDLDTLNHELNNLYGSAFD